jgi:diketogulonate reductase-like aldo/keto reductase
MPNPSADQSASGVTVRASGRIGLGTWRIGDDPTERKRDIHAVTHALQIGYRLIDTAELYGDGETERVVGEALQAFGNARRSELFIVSKVMSEHASAAGTVQACEQSLRRLGCSYLDLYAEGIRRADAPRTDPQLRCQRF